MLFFFECDTRAVIVVAVTALCELDSPVSNIQLAVNETLWTTSGSVEMQMFFSVHNDGWRAILVTEWHAIETEDDVISRLSCRIRLRISYVINVVP